MRLLAIRDVANMLITLSDNRVTLGQQSSPLTSSNRKAIRANLDATIERCNELGTLSQSLIYAQRLRDNAATATVASEIATQIDILLQRIEDELQSTVCFVIQPDKSRLFVEKTPFGGEVPASFPESILDIEEASKCLGLGRATAAVFHLMRVVEVGLKAVGGKLNIPYAPSWESYLTQIRKQLDTDWGNKTPDWKQDEPFFRGVLVHLEAVKLAWRNPTMHIVNHYTPDQAEDVFNSVRGFMRHLAAKFGPAVPAV